MHFQSFTENFDGFKWNLLIRGRMHLIGVWLYGLHGDGEDGFTLFATTLLTGCGKLKMRNGMSN